MPDWAPLSGAILVGGRSRRMGMDKALLTMDGTTPLVAHLVGVLGTCCDEVMLVGGEADRFAGLGLAARWLPDATPDAGPLGGILGALEAARNDACLVVACDMPLLTPAVVCALAEAPRDYLALACPGQGGLEPLLAIYTAACIGPLREALLAGDLQARRFLERMEARSLPGEIVDRVDPGGRAASNVNTPEEFAAIRAGIVDRR